MPDRLTPVQQNLIDSLSELITVQCGRALTLAEDWKHDKPIVTVITFQPRAPYRNAITISTNYGEDNIR